MLGKSKMQNKRIRLIAQIVLVVLFLVIVGFILREHTPKILKLLEHGSVTDIERYIQQEGSKGRAILIVLQIIETVSIVLPAMPVYICAGAVFGKLLGFLMCYTTNIVMNVLIFLVAGRLKANAAGTGIFQKNQRLEGWMKNATRMDRVVIVMCLLPIVPNGMIPYLSAQTKIRLEQFTLAICIGCAPSILMYAVCGDFLLSEHFKVTLPVVIVIAAAACLIMVFRKKVTAWLEPKIKKFIGIEDS